MTGRGAGPLHALRLGDDVRRLGRLARRALGLDARAPVPDGPPGPCAAELLRMLRADDDRAVDVGAGATLIAWEDDAALDVERTLDEVAWTAFALRDRLARARTAADRLEVANRFFFGELGLAAPSLRASDRLADLLLPYVLRRGRGHCVGLSTLYLAVGLRAGLPLFGVSAPGHFFVRWDGEGLRQNIETTARGAAFPDAYYVERFRIPAPLVDRGVYLQNLRRREALVEVLNNRANVFWDRGDVARVSRDLDRVVAVSQSFLRAYVGRGFAALQRGDLAAAGASLEKALEIDPDCARAQLLLGEVDLRRGRLERAAAAFERAAAAGDESVALALTNLGRVLGRRGALDEAIERHRAAIATDRTCHVAWNNLGVALRAVGDVRGARAAFTEARRLAPEFLPARENLVLVARTDLVVPWTAYPGFVGVCEDYEARLRRAPADDETRAAYVRFLVEAGRRLDRALELAARAASANRSVRNLESLALALRRTASPGQAARAIEDALEVDRGLGGPDAERLARLLARLQAEAAAAAAPTS